MTNLPKRIICNAENQIEKFELERFEKSLERYGKYDKKILEKELDEFSKYDPLHYSCLVEVGTACLIDDEDAKKYCEDHARDERGFERLRRITGYLVGSLERWNDGKKAEERERVKHNVAGVYTEEEKAAREAEKLAHVTDSQDEYHRMGTCYD